MQRPGFTLVQMMLYVGLSGTILFATSLVMIQLLENRERARVVAEVEGQGQAIMHMLSQSIRQSEAITAPVPGSSASSLTLDVVNALNDPTVIDLSGGALRITEGAGSPVDLTSGRITVSSFTATNNSVSGTPGSLSFSFTLSYEGIANREEYTYDQTFTTTASLR